MGQHQIILSNAHDVLPINEELDLAETEMNVPLLARAMHGASPPLRMRH